LNYVVIFCLLLHRHKNIAQMQYIAGAINNNTLMISGSNPLFTLLQTSGKTMTI